jgi:excisionase family DNA binding protein
MPESEHYTTAEVATLLRIKPGSVSKMITRGQLPAVKTRKRWLIKKDVVDARLQPSAPQGT